MIDKMDPHAYIQGFQSLDSKNRLHTMEKFLLKLKLKPVLNDISQVYLFILHNLHIYNFYLVRLKTENNELLYLLIERL